MTITAQTLPPKFLGDASAMDPDDWLLLNAIHVRERWRALIDNCAWLDLEPPAETDYPLYAETQYDTERIRRMYCKGDL